MAAASTHVIVGGGQAGARAAEAMRKAGFDGRIVLVAAEHRPPYERPPLSKQLLIDDAAEPASTFVHPADFYAAHEIELRLGCRVTEIDRARREVALDDGDRLAYDKLLLATGSRLRRLDVPGGDLAGVHYLRTIEDSLAIRADLAAGARTVVIGGGYIGLEVAAAARRRGVPVTVIEMQDQVMTRALDREVAGILAAFHRDHGVDIRLETRTEGFVGTDRVEGVRLQGGEIVPAETVVVGVGIVPGTGLAEAAGLAVDNGIVVDEYGQTSDPAIHAAGDAANHPNPILERRVRLESWQNAQNQGLAVGRAMCGAGEPYAEVPWFWSDQYDLNLQMVGLPERWDRVVFRGDRRAMTFTAFYLRDDCVAAAHAFNSARDIAPARRLIAARRPIDPEALADEAIPLRRMAKDATGS